ALLPSMDLIFLAIGNQPPIFHCSPGLQGLSCMPSEPGNYSFAYEFIVALISHIVNAKHFHSFRNFLVKLTKKKQSFRKNGRGM
ncbi:MAG: hypothetical protein IKL99_06895, partial [Oscillospiraceae bacterium]|nr:hypothetical protein [Oscillospiraceae bacterium]